MKNIDPETIEKYREVWLMRVAGHSFDAIAERVGYADRSGAKRAFDAAAQRYVVEAVEDQRTVQSERLDRLFSGAFTRVLEGDLAFVDVCLRIEKRRADLWGLDAPKRTEVTGTDGEAIQINVADELMARVDAIEAGEELSDVINRTTNE